ncbi:aldolase/citrate lyase family protein [Sphingomonas sp. AOB5]|uniref:HpcH/HpaI aldolase/citrate lyase family protein n=1 Tax=Sphingomonas sp. AOB5 TaxID=3034017 RepID=UPI0023F9BE9B|nr:aldolase/citrate lyase family protein [Sphingomonas sp. AOB5]MDF7775628.1 aldolase/citrate lyase family protein [Sphingomonas sp. AOB5]
MVSTLHPRDALFDGERAPPAIPACEHFAGSAKLIEKAFALQAQLAEPFDITCDCEDGAAAGQEEAHARMVARLIASPANVKGMAGVRIHDPSHPHCLADIDIILEGAGERLAYVTIPKATSAAQVATVVAHLNSRAQSLGIGRSIPVHVLIETHGALAEVWQIAALPNLQVLDFGLMDFVSAHHGAIPASAMRSPGQFEHRLLVRAKSEVVAAALANGLVPAHNVCLDLRDTDRIGDDARRARYEFGFLRMWSIYPAQIQPIVEAMRADFDEIEAASRILLAAQAASWGPIQDEGELHDRATYRYFWNLLERAEATGAAIPQAARDAFFA